MKIKATLLMVVALVMTMFSAPTFAATDDVSADRTTFAIVGGATLAAINDAVIPAGIVLVMLNNGYNYAADCPKEVYDAPLVTAAHRDNPNGYHFVTTACDFKLNSDSLIKIE